MLLRGAGWLCTKTGDTLHVSALSPDTVCVVEAGEWHRLVLLPGACVLIMENADMSRSESMPMPRQDRAAILRALDAPPR